MFSGKEWLEKRGQWTCVSSDEGGYSVQMIHLYHFVWYFPFLFFFLLKVFAHRVRNIRMNFLCQSHLHTASETFVHHKKIQIRLNCLRFRIRNKHFHRKGRRIRNPKRPSLGKKYIWKFRTQCARTLTLLLHVITWRNMTTDKRFNLHWKKME